MIVKSSTRRVLRWEKLQGPRALTALVVATAGGAGLTPIAPGTMGALIAVPIAYFTAHSDTFFRLALWIGLLALGTWSAKVLDEIMGSEDNQNIVIDEVVGLGIAAWTAGIHFNTLFAAFVLFRFFDILKPPPVRQIDRWSKIQASRRDDRDGASATRALWWGGFGVMADDVMAGFQALFVILLLQHYQVLP